MTCWDSCPGNVITFLPCSGHLLLAFVSHKTLSEMVWTDLVSLIFLMHHWDNSLLQSECKLVTVVSMSFFLIPILNVFRKMTALIWYWYIWLNKKWLEPHLMSVCTKSTMYLIKISFYRFFFLIMQVLPNHFKRADSIRQVSSCALSETKNNV